MDDEENDLDGLFEEYENDNDENANNNAGTNNSAQPTENAERVAAPRRAVKNPRLKFNADRLCGERGIPVVVKHFEGVKFKGKGHEVEDLNKLLSTLEHWCHRLYPSMKFEDCLRQIEKLGKKRPVQTCLRKIRLDMPILNDDFVGNEREENENQQDEDMEIPAQDAFDRLISETQDNSTAQLSSTPLPVKISASGQSLGSYFSTLTDEQKKRMEYNKMLATERRKAKFLAMKSTVPGDENENLVSTKSVTATPNQEEITSLSEDFFAAPNQEEINSLSEDIFTDSTSLLAPETNKLPSTSNDYSEELELDDLVDLVDEDDEPSVIRHEKDNCNIFPERNIHGNGQNKFIDLCNEDDLNRIDKNCTEIVDLENEAGENSLQNKVIEVINLEGKYNNNKSVAVIDLESGKSINNSVPVVNLEAEKVIDLANEESADHSNSDVEFISTPALFATEGFERSTSDRDETSRTQNACKALQGDVETMEID